MLDRNYTSFDVFNVKSIGRSVDMGAWTLVAATIGTMSCAI